MGSIPTEFTDLYDALHRALVIMKKYESELLSWEDPVNQTQLVTAVKRLMRDLSFGDKSIMDDEEFRRLAQCVSTL